MEGLGVAANVIAIVDISFKLAEWCVQYAHNVKSAREDIGKLQKEVANFQVTIGQVKSLTEGLGGHALQVSRQLDSAIKDARSMLEELADALQPSTRTKAMSRFGLRALTWPFKSKATDVTIQRLTRCRENIMFALSIDQTNIIQHVGHTTALGRLPVATGAAFNSRAEEHNPMCLPDTRVELLDDISRWIEDPDAKPVFWLNGKAGTGKSTISRTIARLRSRHGDLGASFFFKRGEGDRGSLDKFVPTLASQLAQNVPATAPYIKNAIDTNPAIVGQGVREQFDKLIREPLSKVFEATASPSSLVIVIDALDECEQDNDIKLLISILTDTQTLRLRLRIFLSSRPELPIHLGFSEVKGTYRDLILDQVPVQTVEHDIYVFLADEFRKIRNNFNMTVGDEEKLPSDWPGHQTLQTLTAMAVPLFIFASTVCRFVGDRKRGSPPTQLDKVLGHEHKSHGPQLDSTYGPVLRSQVDGVSRIDKEQIIQDFGMIVGSIVVLTSPLSIAALSQLLDVSPRTVGDRLDMLHSVLSIPMSRNSPVRLLHLSFRDYLIDSEDKETNEFWVDEKSVHRNLAKHCLRILHRSLHENICGIRTPGTRRSMIDTQQLAACFPSELQYACLFWVHHRVAVDPKPGDTNDIHDFLGEHFLHWLEMMSLIGQAKETLAQLESLREWLQHRKSPSLSSFVDDAIRFVQTDLSVIDEAPLQIYSSALVFAPNKSLVRMLFEGRVPQWLCLWPHVEEHWDACLLTLEGHASRIHSVVFSHDSKLMASASEDDTVRIWNVETGKCKHVLKGHNSSVNSVAFSHDSEHVASASRDTTVQIWSTEMGVCECILNGHSSSVNSVTFSHDSKLIVSASRDTTVRVWIAEAGKCEQTLTGHGSSVNSAVFSPDSKLVASASKDNTIRIWSTETGICECILKGHSSSVNSAVFSHNSKFIASASFDNTVRVWNVEAGKCEQILTGHSSSVNLAIFSPNSQFVASASRDKTVRVWNVEAGKCEQTLIGHSSSVNSVVFSHDSKLIASASRDKTVRVWRAKTGKCEQTLSGHGSSASSVVFSHDSKLVASASFDNSIRVWRVEAGKSEKVLDSHAGEVYSVVFSHDSNLVASGSDDKTVRIWRVATGECEQVLEGHNSSVNSVVFSHDSKLVASGSDDNTVRIWRVATGKCEQVLEGHADWVYSVAFSHDSKLVASGSFDKTIRVWNVSTYVCEHVIHQRQITRQLYFEAGDDGLVTDAGVISIVEESILSANASILSIPPPDVDLGINGNVSWIAYCGKEFFWLPAECRHGTTAISEKSVVIGCSSGRMVILTFSSDELSRSVK